MPAIRTDRHLAIALRKQGQSYNEIHQQLGIPKSTLVCWFKGNQWSENIKKDLVKKAQVLAMPKLKLMSIANKRKWETWHQECRQKAIKEFPLLKDNLLFVAGLMLYWGEGDKVLKNGIVRLSNCDPEMIKVFHSFLKKSLKIPKEKIIIKLILYPDLEDITYRKYWSKVLNIPLKQFRTSVIIRGRHPNKRLTYGICSIEVYSSSLKEKILTWLSLYKEYFSGKPPMI